VPEPPTLGIDLSLSSAISAASANTTTRNLFGQDVREFVNTASLASPSPATHSSVSPSQLLETSVSSLLNSASQHGLTTNTNNRLRTTKQVFHTGEELALHYGIPTLLPPPPKIQKKQEPESPLFDFDTLRSNYLNMISQKPSENHMSVDTPSPADLLPSSHMEPTDHSLEEWVNSLTSPHWDFLTSPAALGTPEHDFESSSPNETPFSEFLNTPLIGDAADEFSSPAFSSDLPLFGADCADEHLTAAPASVKAKSAELPPELPDFLLQMPPEVIDPTSIYPSPAPLPPPTSFPCSSAASTSAIEASTTMTTRRRTTATGTRKNISPEKLIPFDAPTQPRRYLTSSATSRKELPAVFLKKRQRAEVDDEEDELLEPLPVNATEREQIEHKRRQNTLAARKSRKRKLLHQQELEGRVEQLAEDVTRWRTRCDMLSQLLRSHGIQTPTFTD
jgi:hypothetical protein